MSNNHAVLIEFDEVIDVVNETSDPKRADYIRRFTVDGAPDAPLRISADVRTQGVTGVPGTACAVFFNLEYAQGPIFWDTFLYPDTGSTPWRRLSCEVQPRGDVRVVELHIRFHHKGRLSVRGLRVETIEPCRNDADVVVAVFGDSTDMTSYLPQEHRLTRRLELLLRDRFADHRVDVRGLAEGGEYLQRLLDSGRLERELRILPRGDVIMIRYGINDRNHHIAPQEFGAQLRTACDLVSTRFPKAAVVLSTTIPPDTEAFNRQTQAVAEERKLPLIRVDEMLRQRTAEGDWDWHHDPGRRIGRHRHRTQADSPAALAGDVHPNAHGAQMIAELYFEHLEPIIASRLGQHDQGVVAE